MNQAAGSRAKATLTALRLIRSSDPAQEATDVPSFEREAQFGAWKARVYFGSVPAEALRLIGIYDVGRNIYLDQLFGRSLFREGMSNAEYIAAVDAAIDDAVGAYALPPEWCDRRRLYSLVWAEREIGDNVAEVEGAGRHYWVADSAIRTLVAKYESEAENVVGYAVARLMLGPPRLNGPTYDGCPRLMLAVDGRELSPLATIKLSASATVGRNWNNVLDPVRSRSFEAVDVSKKELEAIGRIGQWHLQALEESDPIRRFMWSYVGLEIIANAVTSVGRNDLIAVLAARSGIDGVVIQELLYPPDVREADPNRSIRFRFAITALLLSPSSVTEDVSEFQRINAFRNGIHGRLVVRRNTVNAFNLFEKYSLLAVPFLAGESPLGEDAGTSTSKQRADDSADNAADGEGGTAQLPTRG